MIPFLLILSAPSGVGKTTIAQALLAARDDLGFSVSATTRPPRPGEQDGVQYHFLTRQEFDRRAAAGEFLEWAEYGGHRYGTLAAEVDRVLASGRHVVLDIEVQGARQVRQRCQNVVSVFILPPSGWDLLGRLGGRNTERPKELAVRLRRAVEELREAPTYDYVVINADRAQAVADVAAILEAEVRRPRRQDDLDHTLQTLIREIAEQADAIERT
jgi:guanylate kinase